MPASKKNKMNNIKTQYGSNVSKRSRTRQDAIKGKGIAKKKANDRKFAKTSRLIAVNTKTRTNLNNMLASFGSMSTKAPTTESKRNASLRKRRRLITEIKKYATEIQNRKKNVKKIGGNLGNLKL